MPYLALAAYYVGAFSVAGMLAWKDQPGYALLAIFIAAIIGPEVRRG